METEKISQPEIKKNSLKTEKQEIIKKTIATFEQIIENSPNLQALKINREEIVSSVIHDFNKLPDDPSLRAGFINSLPDQVQSRILEKKFNKNKKKFIRVAGEFKDIDKRAKAA